MSGPGQVVIIGAGPTGLGAAYRLNELRYSDYRVLERRDHPGGLASSYRDDMGFTWDVGGHVAHSHYAYFDDVVDQVLGDRRFYHVRESWICLKERFVPYPFQYNLHHLDAEDCQKALRGLEQLPGGDHPADNLADWIDATFGPGIGELFMHPYNKKVWGFALDTLSADWIRDRVAMPDVRRVRQNIEARRDDISWGPNSRFFYPAEGGIGAIWRGVSSRLPPDRLAWKATVASVDLSARQLTLVDGATVGYTSLISSIPLDLLCGMCCGLDEGTLQAATELVHSSCHIIGIGIHGPKPDHLNTSCWIYFPEAEIPYYRATVLSNYSPHNVPAGDGLWSLMVEVCETPLYPVDQEQVVEDCIARLRSDGLIPGPAEIVSRWHRREEYGYPTPFLDRRRVLGSICRAFEAHGVYSRGRFGAWQYEVSNQDHSFMQGVEVVNRLLGLGDETTLDHPDKVNRG